MLTAKNNLILKTAVLSLVLIFSIGLVTSAQAMKITSLGYKPEQTGGGGWTGGNLGKTWAEGEWVPYQLVLADVDTSLLGLDSIVISFDFNNSGHRFIDLVRGIQVGTTRLGPTQAWPKPDGSAFPVGTRAEIEIAQAELSAQAFFIGILKEARSQCLVDLDGSADNLLRELFVP